MIISLTPDAINLLLGYSAELFSNMWVLIALTGGVLAGFYIIEESVGLFNIEEADKEDKYFEDSDGNVYGKLPKFVVDAWKRDGKL